MRYVSPRYVYDEKDQAYPVNNREKKKQLIRLHHNFAKVVDSQICSLGFKSQWKSRQNSEIVENISIPGEILYDDGKKREYGVFVYGFSTDKMGIKKTCHHRCFTDYPANKLLEEKINQGCWKVRLEDSKGNLCKYFGGK